MRRWAGAFWGGSLRCVLGRAPALLRRHDERASRRGRAVQRLRDQRQQGHSDSHLDRRPAHHERLPGLLGRLSPPDPGKRGRSTSGWLRWCSASACCVITLELRRRRARSGCRAGHGRQGRPDRRQRSHGSQLPALWRNRTDHVGAPAGLRGFRHVDHWRAAQMDRLACLHGCDTRISLPHRQYLEEPITRHFWSAPGYVTFVAQVAMVIWFLTASISMLLKREIAAMAHAGAMR